MADIRFLADENIPAGSITRLREAGVDVLYIQEVSAGATDIEVLAMAQQ